MLRALYFLFYASGAFWMPFFTVYLRQIGLTGLQIGTLSGIRPLVTLASQPLWGLTADLRGRRRTLLVTMALTSLLILGYGWGGAFWFLLGWTVLYALLSNPVSPLIDSLVLDHLEEQSGSSFGSIRLWGALGWGVAAFVAGRVIGGRDLRLMFPLAAAMFAVGCVIVWRSTRERGTRKATRGNWRGAGALLRNRELITFLLVVLFAQVGSSCVMTFYPIYMDEIGASGGLIGLAYSLQGIAELPFYLASAAIIRRLGPDKTLVLSFVASAVRMLLYSVVRTPELIMFAELGHGLCFSLFLVASVGYVNRRVPSEWRATGQTLFSTATAAAGILGNTWAGLLYDRLDVQTMFRVNGLLVLAVAALALFALRERRPAERLAPQ